jgi:hypothetical protein
MIEVQVFEDFLCGEDGGGGEEEGEGVVVDVSA